MPQENKYLTQDLIYSVAAKHKVQALVKQSGSSFYQGMRFLPKEKREAMFAVYAFCRTVDDIADEAGSAPDKERALNAWDNEINRLYADKTNYQPLNSTAFCLKEAILRFNLPKHELSELINGMRMDIYDRQTPLSQADLSLYCRRVAGTVGVLSMYIFGSSSPQAQDYAVTLGEALQMTNILRDITKDAEMNRIYLPYELLAEYKMEKLTPKEIAAHPLLWLILGRTGQYADELYDKADTILAAMPPQERKLMRPAVMMRNIYYAYLQKMKKRGWDIITPPVKLGKLHKLWLAFGKR